MSSKELSKEIKYKSIELGFTKVGITDAKFYKEDQIYLDRWIKKQRHASIDWIVTRKSERANIFNYYPEAKSVIVVGINYYTGVSPRADNIARFSNYAWGDDYHTVLKKQLYQLLNWIKENNSTVKGVVCVDTSPVMDKVWAQRGG